MIDDSLRKMADRIQARAVRRCGELLKQHNSQGRRSDQLSGTAPTKSQREAADAAGLSKDQEVAAVRVANVPDNQFKVAVEGDDMHQRACRVLRLNHYHGSSAQLNRVAGIIDPNEGLLLFDPYPTARTGIPSEITIIADQVIPE